MLFTPRAKQNGPAFLLGWVVGLGVLATLVYVVADAANVATDSGASDSTSTIKVVLGGALIVGGLRRLRKRTPAGAEPEMPKWMADVDGFTPAKAWLTVHNEAVMAVLFLVFGVVILAQGTGRLSS